MFERIGIVGSGVMGQGILKLLLSKSLAESYVVVSRSVNETRQKIRKSFDYEKKRNKITQEEIEGAIDRVVVSDDFDELSECKLVIEAINEDVISKKEVISKISNVVSIDCVIATNTSSISITELSGSVSNPCRFIGIHFFNPVSVMNLVEVVQGLNTSEEVVLTIESFVGDLNKTAIRVSDSPGFVVNRMLIPMINEAVFILSEGVADAKQIDSAMKLGANHPIGPLALSDLIGNDICLSIMDTLYKETGDQKYKACYLLKKMVRGNLLGRKTNKGFFEYGK